MAGGIGNVGHGNVHHAAAAPLTPDQVLQNAETKVANRGIGDKLVAWLRNKGVVKTQSPTMQAVRQAIETKVGQASAQRIFQHLNMGAGRSLSDRKITSAIDLANRIQAGRQTPIGQALTNLPPPGTTGVSGEDRFAFNLIGVEKAMAASGVDRGNLTDSELVAIFDYTAEGYSQINDDLRTGAPSADTRTYAATLNGALAKLPDYQGEVYRGARLNQGTLDPYQNAATQLKGGNQHATVTELGFGSSSKARGVAEDFGGISATMMFISGNGGKDISGFSRSPSEQEVLWPSGQQYKVLDFAKGHDSQAGIVDPNRSVRVDITMAKA